MYSAYFGLRDNPFSITPDPHYLYLSPYHQEALAHLLYGAEENGGFVQLTGEVGTGKTTLIRTLLEQRLEQVDIALCLNPRLTVEEFVASICDELQINYPRNSRTLKPLLDALNAHLLETHAQGRRTVLVIDEAQNLSREVLEQVRLLTNLETHRHKLLRIILVGQPELQHLLARQDMRQLAQRITARYHLVPLSRQETMAYIRHRLQVAGGRDDFYTPGALKAIHGLTGGIPRLINVICDRALLGAYSQGKKRITVKTVHRAARETWPDKVIPRQGRRRVKLALVMVLVGLLGVMAGLEWRFLPSVLIPQVDAVLAAFQPVNELIDAPQETVVSTPSKLEPAPVEEASPAPLKTSTAEVSLFDPDIPDDAGERLLALWQEEASIPASVPFCDYVQQLEFRCLKGKADWQELRRYNRPVILSLQSEQGQERQVLLRSLDAESAVLDMGDTPIRTERTWLDELWTGNYLLLWRPEISTELIGPGSVSQSVVWLRQRLAQVQDESLPLPSLPQVFDARLARQVRDFQQTHRLRPDGLVGERTMALLHSLAPAPGSPSLEPPYTQEVP